MTYDELENTLRYLAELKYQTHTIHAAPEALRQAANAIVQLQAENKQREEIIENHRAARNKLEADLAAARARLPAAPMRESECATLEQWRHRAMYLESQWAGCSHDCARIQTQRDKAQADLAAARELLQKLRDGARLCRGGGVAGQQVGNEYYSILVTGHTLGDIDAALAGVVK